MSAPTRPCSSQRPSVGRRILVSSFRMVDLPAPFGPMIPSASPAAGVEGHVPDRPELVALQLVRAARGPRHAAPE